MWLKLTGGVMVVISCSMMGFIIAGNFKYRPKTLRNLQVALSMLETEINYGHSPLPEALKSISKKCEKDVAELFVITAKNLSSRNGLTANEAWEKSLKDFYINSYITDNDYEILMAFGKYLGSTDKQNQIKNIKLTLDNLRQQEITSIEEKQKNEKLWKYLGVLSGLMILLLLY
ncbi:MAG TPA: stage III sporulation protein AB [Thermoanaerobacterales bacterium]|nr:stage III sporulation protein AB [Thermoanaerobacterales bacterium]